MYFDSAIFNHSFCHYSGILNNWKIIIEAGNKTRRSTSILLIYPITSVTKMYCVKCNFFNFFLIANIYCILSVWVALSALYIYVFTYVCMYVFFTFDCLHPFLPCPHPSPTSGNHQVVLYMRLVFSFSFRFHI